jgi:3-oxoacyl-[acyl-carrier-protein] synthase II
VGVVSPLGTSVPDYWRSLLAGKSGISRLQRFDSSPFTTSVAAQVTGFDPLEHADARTVRTTDPSAIYLLAAAREALAAAHGTRGLRPAAVGVVVGLDIAHDSVRRAALALERDGQIGVDAFALVQALPNSASSLVSQTFGFRGAQYALSGACASGVLALLHAWSLIQLGSVDAAVAGSAATLSPLAVASCCAARVVTRNPDPATASRPFDKLRDGFVIGEGAAALVVEDLGHATKRDAPILCELLGGWQNSSISGYTVNPAADAAECMSGALRATGVDPSEVDIVGAHATSTPIGDRQEAEALRTVFDGRTVPAFAVKSMLGHCASAAGGLETIALILALGNGIAPPTVNYEHPDPACDVDCVPNQARRIEARIGLKNSFGFGGVNSALVLRRWDA